ncbi:MAG: carboxymuconolactone decarboxylase family protein [Alphaproteobacteria bacterium]|nr:MAG: carboxymuconolactone decarboxylase family protein [Alphaproteobacteria bacterium]
MSEAKLKLSPVALDKADGKAKSLLEGAKAKTGFVPNLYAVMANAPALLDIYLKGVNDFRGESGFSPAEQEVIFLGVSRANDCHYCVAAHSMMAEKVAKVPAESVKALRAGKPLPDARLEALNRFVRHMWETRGNPTQAELDAFRQAGFNDRQILYIVLAMALKTLSNYTNHLFATEVDNAFADYKLAS